MKQTSPNCSVIRTALVTLSLMFCTSIFAEPVMYICERPTWGNDEGCGPNKARYTYGFLINTDDFNPSLGEDESSSAKSDYVFAEARGCSLERARGKAGRFWSTDEGFVFGMDHGRVVELHTIPMNAKIHGAGVKHSPYMTCEELKGEAIVAHPRIGALGFVTMQPGYVGPSPVANPGAYSQ